VKKNYEYWSIFDEVIRRTKCANFGQPCKQVALTVVEEVRLYGWWRQGSLTKNPKFFVPSFF